MIFIIGSCNNLQTKIKNLPFLATKLNAEVCGYYSPIGKNEIIKKSITSKAKRERAFRPSSSLPLPPAPAP
jgi:hypothetical protein